MTAENEKGEIERYQVDEFYRMRYDQTRIRLLDFHRSAKQVLTTEQSVVTDGQLNLGVTDKEVQYLSDSTGQIVAFVQQGDCLLYTSYLNKEISKYISKVLVNESNPNDSQYISALFKVCGNVERIGDHAMNICEYTKMIEKQGISFSEEVKDCLLYTSFCATFVYDQRS